MARARFFAVTSGLASAALLHHIMMDAENKKQSERQVVPARPLPPLPSLPSTPLPPVAEHKAEEKKPAHLPFYGLYPLGMSQPFFKPTDKQDAFQRLVSRLKNAKDAEDAFDILQHSILKEVINSVARVILVMSILQSKDTAEVDRDIVSNQEYVLKKLKKIIPTLFVSLDDRRRCSEVLEPIAKDTFWSIIQQPAHINAAPSMKK